MAKRGRPAFKPTADHKKKAKKLAAGGHSIADAARVMGLSKPTFRLYFAEYFSGKKKKTKAPEFKITRAVRARVGRLIGAKMSEEKVAKLLGCTVDQLREWFAEEIELGAIKLEATLIDDLVEQSAAGKTAASNQLHARITASDEKQPAAAVVVGKKAAAKQQARAAIEGGSRFAPRPPPKLVVNNE